MRDPQQRLSQKPPRTTEKGYAIARIRIINAERNRTVLQQRRGLTHMPEALLVRGGAAIRGMPDVPPSRGHRMQQLRYGRGVLRPEFQAALRIRQQARETEPVIVAGCPG